MRRRFEPGLGRLRVAALLALAGIGLPRAGRTADLPAAQLADELEALVRVPAVAGREAPAAAFIRGRLAALTESRGPAPGGTAAGSRRAGRPPGDSPAAADDALGNVILTVGSGAPRKLAACALGEPGFAVSRIEEDGYLRLVPVGSAIPAGALWEQAHEGQTVMVAGARGDVPGAVAVRSVHLQQGQVEGSDLPFSAADAFVDVGAESSAEVAALGIRLLDPVALVRRPVRLPGGLIAGAWVRQKAACLALVAAARHAVGAPATGTVVFAWTALDLINGAGLAYLVRERGPFDQVILLDAGFGWERKDGQTRPTALPHPNAGLLAGRGAGSGPADGLLTSGALPPRLAASTSAPHLPPAPRFTLDWGAAQVGFLGLPALYPGTPVETVALADVQRLTGALLAAILDPAADPNTPASPIASTPPTASSAPAAAAAATAVTAAAARRSSRAARHAESAALLGSLVIRYGVSGAEGPVREEVLRRLPSWAKPAIDRAGNLTLTFGSPAAGAASTPLPLLFLAHLDEVGFRVAEVLPDGRLRLERQGGLQSTLWEAQAALVHTARGPVPALFEPRADWLTATRRSLSGEPAVWLGAANPEEVRALGVAAGDRVSMPKDFWRLGRHRVLGRAMDDRVGCSALLLALRRIDPAKLRRQVTFAWTVGEEIGLQGALALAQGLPGRRRVFAVDTFVSSDSPRESRRFAYAPLGRGAVLRAMDNATFAPRDLVAHVLDLGRRRRLPLQVGFTGGGTDGVPFIAHGDAMLPISWPGRYSHSPVEVADLRDLETLVDLVVGLITAGESGP